MAQYNSLNVKLLNSQHDKLKSKKQKLFRDHHQI